MTEATNKTSHQQRTPQPLDQVRHSQEDPVGLQIPPPNNKRQEAHGWPPCIGCQPPFRGDTLSNAPPPLLLPPIRSKQILTEDRKYTPRKRKLYRYHLHMAEALRPLLMALHGLHHGRTFSPMPVPACHWQCALPLHRCQWRRLHLTPLSQYIRQLNEGVRRPCNQGTTPPQLLSAHTDPYNPTPHLHVHKSLAKANLVALPATPIQSLPFPSLLPPEIATTYLSQDTVISQNPEDWKRAAKFHLTARLPLNEYGYLLLRLLKLGMARCYKKYQIKVRNGIQLVWKDNQEQRLIFDGRPVNCVLFPPPTVSLPHPTDLQTIHLAPHEILLAAKLDLDAYYHRLAVPNWLPPFLGIPSLPLRKLPTELRQQLQWAADIPTTESYLHPAVTTLPMGLFHSVYIAQHIHLYLLSKIHPMLNLPPPNNALSSSTSIISQVYIDDHCLIWRTSPYKVEQTRNEATTIVKQLTKAYAEAGLPTKPSKTVFPTYSLTFLGISLHGDSGKLLPVTERVTELFAATKWVLDTRVVNIKQLQCLIGHWVWLLLLRRPLLSVLYYSYRFQQAFLTTRPLPPIWASVANELRSLMALTPMLFIDLRRPHASSILASDASETGGGACMAYSPAIPTPDPTLHEWTTLFAFPWRYPEPIIYLEGRALLYTIRRTTHSYSGLFRRLLIFIDNQPLSFAVNKGRSSTLKLARILRALAASLLMTSDTLTTHGLSPTLWRITQGLQPATINTYALAIRRFLQFTNRTTTNLSIDERLLSYAASLPPSSRNQPFSKLISAIRHILPAAPLPESRRLQNQLLRVRHAISAPPMLYEITLLVARQLIKNDFPTTALGLLLQFDTYLRPGELCLIRGMDLHFPAPLPPPFDLPLPILALPRAKTGLSQSVTIRDKKLYKPLHQLATTTSPFSLPLFPNYATYLARFSHALQQLSLSDANYTPHSVRHGGATTDLLRQGEQALPSILFRGRWESTAGRRYLQMGPAAILQARQPNFSANLLQRTLQEVSLTLNTELFTKGK